MTALTSVMTASPPLSDPLNRVESTGASSNDFNTLFASVLANTQIQSNLIGAQSSSNPLSISGTPSEAVTPSSNTTQTPPVSSDTSSMSQDHQSAIDQVHHAKHAHEIKKAEGKKTGHASHHETKSNSDSTASSVDPNQATLNQSMNGQTGSTPVSAASQTSGNPATSDASNSIDHTATYANDPTSDGSSETNQNALLTDGSESSHTFVMDDSVKTTGFEFANSETNASMMMGSSSPGAGSGTALNPTFSLETPTAQNALLGRSLQGGISSLAGQNLSSVAKGMSAISGEANPFNVEGMQSDNGSAVTLNTTPENATNTSSLNIPIPFGEGPWAAAFGQQALFMAKNDLGTAQLTLNPEHLGPIQVTLDLQHDQASAVFVSPHDAVRQAIEASLPQLRDMFSQAGLQLGQTQVQPDLNGQFAQSSRQNSGNSAQRNTLGTASQMKEGISNVVDAVSVPLSSRVSRGLLDTFA